MRIAVAGGGLLAGSLLSAVLDSHHELVAVVQDGRRARGLRRRVSPAIESVLAPSRSAVTIAKRNKVPVLYIDKMSEEELAPLRHIDPDLYTGVILPILTTPAYVDFLVLRLCGSIVLLVRHRCGMANHYSLAHRLDRYLFLV